MLCLLLFLYLTLFILSFHVFQFISFCHIRCVIVVNSSAYLLSYSLVARLLPFRIYLLFFIYAVPSLSILGRVSHGLPTLSLSLSDGFLIVG
ncbi:hypothetical protein JB92DRAFT_163258 [Gautieria morchelliformis]|nr:hypothetical protein JB92DRAFT_163258 [Gautieria morchelliformis]